MALNALLSAFDASTSAVLGVQGTLRLQMGEPRVAAAALERAVAQLPGDNDLDLLQALTDALALSGQPDRAVSTVAGIRSKLEQASNAEEAGVSKGASSYELTLLEAKILAGWKGHTPDALARYDNLISQYAGPSPDSISMASSALHTLVYAAGTVV